MEDRRGESVEEFQARAHIEKLQEKRLTSDSDVLDSLAGAIDRLGKVFPKRGHFLMEFVQNADDAKSTELVIDIDTQRALITNNGCPFKPEDVDSICKVGRSSKSPDAYIGYLGVGFKSVFLISDRPSIDSPPYRFRFDRQHWTASRVESLPWQIIPIWEYEPLQRPEDASRHDTLFKVPFSRGGDHDLAGKLANGRWGRYPW